MVVTLLVWWPEEEKEVAMMKMKEPVLMEWRPAARYHRAGLWVAVILAALGCRLPPEPLTVATRTLGLPPSVRATALLDRVSEYQSQYSARVLPPGVDSMSLCSLEIDAPFVW